jgi:hypothetical protein
MILLFNWPKECYAKYLNFVIDAVECRYIFMYNVLFVNTVHLQFYLFL